MGRHFGIISKKGTGLVTYALSPHELKAFPFVWDKVIPNTLRRIRGKWFVALIPIGVYYWGKSAQATRAHMETKEYLAEHPDA